MSRGQNNKKPKGDQQSQAASEEMKSIRSMKIASLFSLSIFTFLCCLTVFKTLFIFCFVLDHARFSADLMEFQMRVISGLKVKDTWDGAREKHVKIAKNDLRPEPEHENKSHEFRGLARRLSMMNVSRWRGELELVNFTLDYGIIDMWLGNSFWNPFQVARLWLKLWLLEQQPVEQSEMHCNAPQETFFSDCLQSRGLSGWSYAIARCLNLQLHAVNLCELENVIKKLFGRSLMRLHSRRRITELFTFFYFLLDFAVAVLAVR